MSSDSAVGADRDDIGGVVGVASTSAIAELERRTADDPEDLPAWQELSRRYLREAVATGDPAFYDLTRNALDRAGALAPGDPATTVTEGALALSLHDFARGPRARPHRARAGARRPRPAGHPHRRQRRARPLRRSRGPPLRPAGPPPRQRRALPPVVPARAARRPRRRPPGHAAGRAGHQRARGPRHDRHAHRRPAPGLARPDRRRGRVRTGPHGGARTGRHRDRPRPCGRGPGPSRRGRRHADRARRALPRARPGQRPGRAPAGGRPRRRGRRQLRPRPRRHRAPRRRRLHRRPGVGPLRRRPRGRDRGRDVGRGRLPHAPHRVHRRRAGLGARRRPVALRRRCRTSRRRAASGTRSPALHVHAAVALAATGDPAQAATALRTAFGSSAWLVPALRPEAAALADRLGVPVPEDWRP